VLFDELYGSESISQVYGILIDWYKNLSNKDGIKEILYDDCCHLKRFSENPLRAQRSDVTKAFADISKHVDKFHFKNHVDKWCQEHCDPYKVKYLEGLNTQICEQLFKKLTNIQTVRPCLKHISSFFGCT
jgi:hypothetical protein